MKTIYHDQYRSLINALKSARKKAGLTQKDLGELLGADQSYISKIERFQRRLDIIELRSLCDILEISFTDFVRTFEISQDNREHRDHSEPCDFPNKDSDWHETDWRKLIEYLIKKGIITYKEITSLILGHLNPPHVGTSIASKKSFQKQFKPRKCWEAVRRWYYQQRGICEDCGTRLELQADHIEPREKRGDAADRLENMTLRCRRCNVVRLHPK